MKSERRDPKLEDAVRSALHAARAPSPEESNAVKIALYRREAEARKARLLAGACAYAALAGAALTAVGVRRGNLKAELSVRMRRKGAEA